MDGEAQHTFGSGAPGWWRCGMLWGRIVKNRFNPDCKPFRVKFFFAQDPKSLWHSRPNLVNEAEGYSPGFPALLSYSLGRKPPISKQMLTPTYSIAAKYRNMAARRIVWNCENSASLCLPRRNGINTITFFEEAPCLWVISFYSTAQNTFQRVEISPATHGDRGVIWRCLADSEAKSQASSLIHVL